jgi:thymidylate synthase
VSAPVFESSDEWHRILRKVRAHGVERPDRTGVGTLATFGEQLCFDNRVAFPAVTTKKLAFGQVASELAAFLAGHSDLQGFHSVGCKIWDGNGTAEYWKPRAMYEGDLGRIYGVQWRDWLSAPRAGGQPPKSTDQLKELVDGIRRDPFGRRHLVTAWNPGELDQMCLPPCHVLFQAFCYPAEKRMVVDLRVDMRSVDLFLGLPFDIASYALLQRLLCKDLGAISGWLTFQLGDSHIYLNHQAQVAEVLAREPREAPTLRLHRDASLFNFSPDMAELVDYHPHPAVPAPLNV